MITITASGQCEAQNVTWMPTAATTPDLINILNRTQVEFLKLEARIGLTFSDLALETKDAEKRARCRHAARRAYDTILKFMERVAPSRSESLWFETSLLRLKCNLWMLGEIL